MRQPNGPEIQKALLRAFWDKFGDFRFEGRGYDPATKLKALIELRDTVVPYIAHKSNSYRRQQFKERREQLHPLGRFQSCFVCGRRATERHHIIQIQNGGNNARRNLVSLCFKHHLAIHPWLDKNQMRHLTWVVGTFSVDATI